MGCGAFGGAMISGHSQPMNSGIRAKLEIYMNSRGASNGCIDPHDSETYNG